jgi:hypothetical protein
MVTAPPKRTGQGIGPRNINGALLDVRHAALFLGFTEKTLRARVARRLIPFRRFGNRITFVKSELDAFLRSLDGCTLDEALANEQTRRGESA